jgi:hypothetical protein
MLPRESDLYAPIKSFLEAQGYEVKGEVADCDVVAVREGEEPVVVELKTSFSLQLIFQAVRRQALTDTVYVAYPATTTGRTRRRARDISSLCRRLGLGLITVRTSGRGATVEVHLDPSPYRPRQNKRKRGMLLREFARRVGDPNVGGTNKRAIVTAYRQDALRCAQYLHKNGPSKPAIIKAATDVAKAPRILQSDVYGWFHRVERGIYTLTPVGKRALKTYADVVRTLAST